MGYGFDGLVIVLYSIRLPHYVLHCLVSSFSGADKNLTDLAFTKTILAVLLGITILAVDTIK